MAVDQSFFDNMAMVIAINDMSMLVSMSLFHGICHHQNRGQNHNGQGD